MTERALLTCPWCPWSREIRDPDRAALIERGMAVIDAHNRAAGHLIIAGRKPRLGYRKGEPIS